MNKIQLSLILSNAVLISLAQDRPNILVLSIEDTSWYEFGCYGNKCVETPVLDQLSRDGVMFKYAYSNSPQSSPSRSGLITGCYASTYAMDQHRSNPKTPDNIFYPQLLRNAGYYCTNNSKTDYNTTTDNNSCWDECSNNASYNSASRPANKPFFSIYNSFLTHMGRIRSYHTDGRRDFTKENIFVDNAPLPAHLPDIPEVRSDYAFHLEGVKDVDKWVGYFIKDLKSRGLYDNTIIFFFSDHGGCSPRGKGYLYETGLRVPMIVYVPDKYKEQLGITPQTADKPVCFVDLAPTFMQIVGALSPERFQGESFFKPLEGRTKYQYGVCGNQATHFQPLRSVSDGRYKYIRNYIPYKQHALRNYYQWAIPANIGWDSIYQKGLTNDITDNTFKCKFAEELFDLSVDSFETNNLAYLPEYAEINAKMRQKIDEFVTNTGDLGYILPKQRSKVNIYDICHAPGYPLTQLHHLANLTCRVEPTDLPELEVALTSSYPEIRFWGVVNIGQLAFTGKITTAPAGLKTLLGDAFFEITAEAAYALSYLGDSKATMDYFLGVVRSKTNYIDALSLMEVLSLDDRAKFFYTPEIIAELKTYTSVKNYADQNDLGLLIRGVLVNLKEFPANGIYDSSLYDEGLWLNKDRRALVPLPGGVSAYKPFFLENFKPINGQSQLLLPNLNNKTDNPGWLCTSTGVYAQKSTKLGGGLRISSTATTLAWAETPELDLSKSSVLEFESKKWVDAGEGSLYALIDGDTILSLMNGNSTITTRKSVAFYAKDKSRIRFVGKKVTANDICFDSVRVSLTDESTLNLPLIKVLNMGVVKPGIKLNYSLPITIVNGGQATLNFTVSGNENFKIDGESTLVLSNEVTNGTMHFSFDAPEQVGVYTARVDVDCGADFDPRVIWLNIFVDAASYSRNTMEDNLKLFVQHKQIHVTGNEKFQLKLYTTTGQLLDTSSSDANFSVLTAPYEGVYIMQICSVSGISSRKLIIN